MRVQRNEYINEQARQFEAYVDECQRKYGDHLHQSIDLSLGTDLLDADVAPETHTAEPTLLATAEITAEHVQCFGEYLAEYNEIVDMLNEIDAIVCRIADLDATYVQNIAEYNATFAILSE